VADDIPDRCARCNATLDPADCFVVEGTGLCRLEHIVAWVLRGGAPDGPLVVTRHRMGQEIVDEFASAEALRSWASAGGRWGREP
jgi:hypothetical protein